MNIHEKKDGDDSSSANSHINKPEYTTGFTLSEDGKLLVSTHPSKMGDIIRFVILLSLTLTVTNDRSMALI